MQENNYAFIDSQNVNLGIRELGWKLDFRRFRIYLSEKYHIQKAYLFMGYIPENENLYTNLRNFGYSLVFKEIFSNGSKPIKGNCDGELILQAMIDYADYKKAVIVTGDGDFACLVKYLCAHEKLECLLVPNRYQCSGFLKRAARGKWWFMNDLKKKLSLKNQKGHRLRTNP